MSERSFIVSFIRAYKSHPCLWKHGHVDYRNRYKKEFALRELLKILRTRYVDSNLCSVKKRINNMRNCFNKELNKVKRSIRRGDDNIHVPKLWYYNELRFLAKNHIYRPSPGNPKEEGPDHDELQEDIPSEDEDSEVDEDSVDWSKGYVDVPLASAHTSCSNPKQKPIKPVTFPKPTKTDEKPQRLKYSAYGLHVAEKLRAMPELMATFCQKIINDAIFLAETNNLDMMARISQSNPLQGHSDMDMSRSLKRTDEIYEEDTVEIKFNIEKPLSDGKE